MAQQADVNSYLCKFAGKCGTEAAADDTPTKAAPQTKGFRLAPSQAQPTIAAPQTKGFRLATGASQPTVTAPSTKGFRVARAPVAATPEPGRRQARIAATTGSSSASSRESATKASGSGPALSVAMTMSWRVRMAFSRSTGGVMDMGRSVVPSDAGWCGPGLR